MMHTRMHLLTYQLGSRANLDVVDNAFISGKIISDYLDHAAFANRTRMIPDYALLVGGDSAAPENETTKSCNYIWWSCWY